MDINKKKKISIVSPCFNEEENVKEMYSRVKRVMDTLPYDYEYIFIDNSSNDNTINKLMDLAEQDKKVRVIVNEINFGQTRSPFHAVLQSTGDACISIASDLQEPPEKIIELLKKWEEGFSVVLCVKESSEENNFLFYLRKLYYKLLGVFSDGLIVSDATGFGLLDKKVVDILKLVSHRDTYYRGLIANIGFEIATVKYRQNNRKTGRSKNNFFILIEYAMNGIVNHSSKLLRLLSIICAAISFISFLFFIFYLINSLFNTNVSSFSDSYLHIVVFSLLISILFGSQSIIILYLQSTHSYLKNKDLPLVIERKRVNF